MRLVGADSVIVSILNTVVQKMSFDLFERLLPESLSETEKQGFWEMWRGATPRVTYGYPRQAGPWPQWTVILMGEQVEQIPLGYAVEEGLNDKSGFLVTELVDIRTYAKNATYGRLLHYLARGAVLSARDIWLREGYVLVRYRGARDLAPAQEFLPEDIWLRIQSWDFGCKVIVESQRDLEGLLRPPGYVGLEGEEVGPGVRGKVTVTR